MKISKHDTFILFVSEQGDIKEFISEIKNKINPEYQDKNIVVDLLLNTTITLNDLVSFLNLSCNHRELNNSFVIINNTVNSDDLPEELVVVPTLQEAEDMIEMEAIERELGF